MQSNLHANGNSSQSLISTAINHRISPIETIDFCPCIVCDTDSKNAEEFVAMQVDLEIPVVISILKELDVYRG